MAKGGKKRKNNDKNKENSNYDSDSENEELRGREFDEIEPKKKKGRPATKNVQKLNEAISIKWDLVDPSNHPLKHLHGKYHFALLNDICELRTGKIEREDVNKNIPFF